MRLLRRGLEFHGCTIVTLPPRGPRTYQLLWNNFVLASESSYGFRRGISHFFMATRNTTEGVVEREQTNNMGLGRLQSLFCCPLSTAPLRHPSPTPSLSSFFSFLAFPYPLPVSSKISSSGLCLVSRQNRKKGSSAWRATHIVSHYQ